MRALIAKIFYRMAGFTIHSFQQNNKKSSLLFTLKNASNYLSPQYV